MNKAKETDCILADEAETRVDEPDTHADNIESAIEEEQARLTAKQNIKLNGPKPLRLILEAATADEKDIYKEELNQSATLVKPTSHPTKKISIS
jgi:hypothetical protein